MAVDMYLKDGLIATDYGLFRGGLVLKEGKIAQIVASTEKIAADETIDLRGNLIMPGLVDAHVHFNEPGRTHWEGYTTGSQGAAAGGVTTVLEMPLNCTPPVIDVPKLVLKREAIEGKSIVDYAHWGGLVTDNLEELAGLEAQGVIGYKAFMSESGVDFAMVRDDILFEGMKRIAALGNVIGIHAENESLTQYYQGRLRAAGRKDRHAFLESRPPLTELEAIQRAILLAKEAGTHIHIVHVSTAAGAMAVRQAKISGLPVTMETCPHYLSLDEEDFERIGPMAKCSPPLRSRQEVEGLWSLVLEGWVDCIASDHSPCTVEEKERGNDDIWLAWGGITGIQTMLPILLTEGVQRRQMGLERLVQLTSSNPAKIFGVYPQKGALHLGADADLVIVDMEKEWVVSRESLFSRNKQSPFIGCRLKGRVERTIIRGRTVYQDGQFLVEPGFGQLVTRRNLHRSTT